MIKANICYTKKCNLCLGCGICADACPTRSILMDIENGEYRPAVNEQTCLNAKGCHRCTDVCPGLGVNLNEISDVIFGNYELAKKHKLIGTYRTAYSGCATNYETRFHGASGGLLTAFIAFLLDKGYISAAVVTDNDLSQPFLNKTVLVHSSDELKKARSSKYCPVKYDGIIKQIKDETGKVIIVGLPCIIHGYRKYEKLDGKLKEKVLGYFGLYCSCGRTFNLTEYVFKINNIDKKSLSYFQYRDNGCLGNLVAKDKEKTIELPFELYYHPLRSFFIPNRCQLCIDHYAEFADVSFGDIHYGKYKEDKIGVNSVVIRNGKFDELMQEAAINGYVQINILTEEELVRCQASAIKKKGRVGGVLRFSKMMGKKIPEYDVTLTNYIYWKSIAYYLFAKCQMFVGKRRWLWWIIPLMSKKREIS